MLLTKKDVVESVDAALEPRKEEIVQFVYNATLEDGWRRMKEEITSKVEVKPRIEKKKPWISESTLRPIVERRASLGAKQKIEKITKDIRKSAREDRRRWYKEKLDSIEEASIRNNTKSVY